MLERLENRAVLKVVGTEAEHFLENLVTCKVTGLEEGDARFGALLTPQGKILFDFFVIRGKDAYYLDTQSDLADELLKRLTFYRLRAKVELEKLAELAVAAFYGDAPPHAEFTIPDPRHPDMPHRAYGTFQDVADGTTYLEKRVALGIPEGGQDFAYGDSYPHETLMDQFKGVDFRKGCYVGQEVVSRMQHKTQVRKRVIKVRSASGLPPTGSEILADGKPAGAIGSVSGNDGLALVRLDRVHEAKSVTAGGVELNFEIPDWANFDWPQTGPEPGPDAA